MRHSLRFGFAVAVAMLLTAAVPAFADEFPFDREILLDAKPLPGSKRVPILEIGADGRGQVDLWCHSGAAQVVVKRSRSCLARCAKKLARPSAHNVMRKWQRP